MRSTIRILAVIGVFSLLVTIARGDSEIVIAIRYLQAEGISHSHLYLYREDGKLLRQLTNDQHQRQATNRPMAPSRSCCVKIQTMRPIKSICRVMAHIIYRAM
jgi:hypothetical protein